MDWKDWTDINSLDFGLREDGVMPFFSHGHVSVVWPWAESLATNQHIADDKQTTNKHDAGNTSFAKGTASKTI